jgi:NAD(P)-dependent dehydrogenase (short-subunit alcohol dehydrogenase family)
MAARGAIAVTGASRGIGAGIARELARRGWSVGCLSRGGELPDVALARFGELVAQAASPIDDVRGTAAYRRHALAVLARRTLRWAWAER